MRSRFWATIRRPAFSISALTAPVRLRAVASGLMIEKVRSIAIICPWKTTEEVAGAYIGAISLEQADPVTRSRAYLAAGLQRFHPDEPILTRPSRRRSAWRS